MTEIGIKFLAYKENARSNLANERIKLMDHNETVRSNLARESIQRLTLDETVRHNVAVENEQHRSNLMHEANQARSNSIQEQHFIRQDKIAAATQKESKRHNKVNEANTRYQTNMYRLSDSNANTVALYDMNMSTLDRVSGQVVNVFDQVLDGLGGITKFLGLAYK